MLHGTARTRLLVSTRLALLCFVSVLGGKLQAEESNPSVLEPLGGTTIGGNVDTGASFAVPEPSVTALLVVGASGAWLVRRRTRAR